jgi:hypothetical protein
VGKIYNPREKQRVGKEIFKIANGIEIAYDYTLKARNSVYKDIPYNEAISKQELGLKDSTIIHFGAAITPFILPPQTPEPVPGVQTRVSRTSRG